MDKYKSILSESIEQVELGLQKIVIQNEELNSELVSFLNYGSKKIRSIIALLYLNAYSVRISPEIINILTASEIIHNASLLHDDVLDNANSRRGRASLHKIFTPEVAILTGDYLLSFATKKLIETKKLEILEIFRECTQKMSEAEINQYFLRNRIPDETEYIQICKGKTAELFIAILKSVALIANLPTKDACELGENFGVLFQIKNDLEKISADNDKQNGVITAASIFGVEKTNCLIDNYKSKLRRGIEHIPDNIYKKGLEDLIDKL